MTRSGSDLEIGTDRVKVSKQGLTAKNMRAAVRSQSSTRHNSTTGLAAQEADPVINVRTTSTYPADDQGASSSSHLPHTSLEGTDLLLDHVEAHAKIGAVA